MCILNLRLYRCRTDNDVRSWSVRLVRLVRLGGSRGALIVVGKDHLPENQECHDITADIKGEREATRRRPAIGSIVVMPVVNPVECVTSRKRPGDAKAERAGVAGCVRFDGSFLPPVP